MASTQERKDLDASVAGGEQNAGLKHAAGGVTTRDDATDMGVPMLPGRPDEPVGPEDALGVGPKRGDYRGRIGPESYQPHEALADTSDSPAQVRVEAQRPRAEEIGDEPGKGGVAG